MEADQMLEIDILKIEDPGCFWGRITKGAGLHVGDPREYEKLQVQMDLFYHEVNLEAGKLKPPVLEEGQVCVVYSTTLKSWCRAVMESLTAAGSQVLCFLLDHAEHVVVNTNSIRAPLGKFLQLPFWVRKFHLADIHPLTLEVSICLEKAALKPAARWDNSATRYLHKLIQASTLKEAIVCGQERDSTAVQLYLTIENIKVCVNDELVTKKFACSSSTKFEQSLHNSATAPVMLPSHSICSREFRLHTSQSNRSEWSSDSLPSDVQPGTGPNDETVCDNEEVIFWSGGKRQEVSEDKGLHFSPMSTPITAKCAVNGGNKGSGTERNGKFSKTSSRASSEKKGSGSHLELVSEMGTSLAEELTQKLNLLRFMKFLHPASRNGFVHKVGSVQGDPEEVVLTGRPAMAVLPEGPSTVLAPVGNQDECEDVPGQAPYEQRAEHEDSEALKYDYWQLCISDNLTGDQTQESTSLKRVGDELVYARLLQFLNPDNLNPDEESSEMTVWPYPSRRRLLLHSAMAVDPCSTLASSPISDSIKKTLEQKGYNSLGVAESYCWPLVSRGCDSVLISQRANDPLSYIPPCLTHLRLCTVYNILTSCIGPIAVVLCPGWEKAQQVFSLLEEFPAAQLFHPMLILLGCGKDEARTTKMQMNCQLLVTTPFSLLRLLEFHCFLFLRLCLLVLDDVDVLYGRAPQQMSAVLQHFQKAASSECRTSSPRQIVAVGTHWSRHLEGLVRENMRDPSIIITVFEEAAFYGNVHQMVLLCVECTKKSVLLSTLNFIPDMVQKTLIFTNSVDEAEEVFKAVTSVTSLCLKVHERLTYQFDFVMKQWKKDTRPGNHIILVITDDCVKALAIDDATCVVHYGFPSSPRLFGSRLFCMSKNFQNLSDKDCVGKAFRLAQSVLLLSETNTRHVVGVLRYLERTDAELPPELLRFAQGVLQAKEEQKADRPLCSYLKSFGFCRDESVCPDRHRINPTQDAPQHADSQDIMIVPLYIKNASCYYGRIVSKKGDRFESLAAEMAEYYSQEKITATKLMEGGLYGIQEDHVYHRVRLLAVPDRGKHLFCSVNVHFLDEGREEEVKAHQLLELPSCFQSLSPQAVEIVVCRAQPIDGEVDWNPKVTRCIRQKIKGLQHQAKVVLCLGKTVWVDPMVRITCLSGLNIFISEYNVLSEILATGMAVTNPQHIERLKALTKTAITQEQPCETSTNALKECLETRLRFSNDALGNKVKALVESTESGEEVPAAALERKMGLESAVDKQSYSTPSKILEENPHSRSTQSNASLLCAEQDTRARIHRTEMDVPPGAPGNEIPLPAGSVENGLSCDCEVPLTVGCVTDNSSMAPTNAVSAELPQRFHPQIQWFQREKSVTINIKLFNPAEQKCEFFPDRVTYSATVNGRHYQADLALQGSIKPDECTWDVKSHEPVLKLIKTHSGFWEKLLREKNAFVSLDFDHFEEEAEKPQNGHWFVENNGEDACYWTSITENSSSSDSD